MRKMRNVCAHTFTPINWDHDALAGDIGKLQGWKTLGLELSGNRDKYLCTFQVRAIQLALYVENAKPPPLWSEPPMERLAARGEPASLDSE
jgi:hypothetical protein